ncbi:MAG: NfeD family protein [Thermoguttaceae bacterium]
MPPFGWSIIFLLIGLFFACLELFVPSGGLLAFFAFASLCACVVFAFHQGVVVGVLFTLSLLVLTPLLIWQLVLLWPRTPIGKRMLLDPASDPALAPDPEKKVLDKLVGKIGHSVTRMMPSGIVEVEKQRYDAVSDGEPIDPNKKVIVLKANKLNIIVRQILDNELKNEQKQDNQIKKDAPYEPQVADPFAPNT